MDDSGIDARPVLREPDACLWLVILVSAGRFFAAAADDGATFPRFSEADAWRFAKDDEVDLLAPAALAIDAKNNGKKLKFRTHDQG